MILSGPMFFASRQPAVSQDSASRRLHGCLPVGPALYMVGGEGGRAYRNALGMLPTVGGKGRGVMRKTNIPSPRGEDDGTQRVDSTLTAPSERPRRATTQQQRESKVLAPSKRPLITTEPQQRKHVAAADAPMHRARSKTSAASCAPSASPSASPSTLPSGRPSGGPSASPSASTSASPLASPSASAKDAQATASPLDAIKTPSPAPKGRSTSVSRATPTPSCAKDSGASGDNGNRQLFRARPGPSRSVSASNSEGVRPIDDAKNTAPKRQRQRSSDAELALEQKNHGGRSPNGVDGNKELEDPISKRRAERAELRALGRQLPATFTSNASAEGRPAKHARVERSQSVDPKAQPPQASDASGSMSPPAQAGDAAGSMSRPTKDGDANESSQTQATEAGGAPSACATDASNKDGATSSASAEGATSACAPGGALPQAFHIIYIYQHIIYNKDKTYYI